MPTPTPTPAPTQAPVGELEIPLPAGAEGFINLPNNQYMRFNRLIVRGNLSIGQIQPPGPGSFLAGPYTVSLPTIGVVGGADPANTDTNGYATITAIIAGEAGTTVTIPGDYIYEVDQAIQVPSGKTLQATDGTSATIKRKAGYSGNLIEFQACTGSTLANLTIDGDFPNHSGLEGVETANSVYVNGGSDCIIQHCNFVNAPGKAVHAYNSDNLSTIYNIFEDDYAAIYYDGNDLDEAGSITGNTITHDSLRSRISVEIVNTNNLQVFHNNVGGAGSIQGTNVAGQSFFISNSEFFHVENNTCDTSYHSSFQLGDNSTNGTIKHNYFKRGSNTADTGAAFAAILDGAGTDNITYTLNISEGGIISGFAGGDNITITSNVVNTTSVGIYVYGFTITSLVQGNSITRTSGSDNGVYLFNKNTAAVSCQVLDNDIIGFTNAIAITNTGDSGTVFGITATGNTFSGNGTNYAIPIGITLHVSCVLEGYTPASTPAPTPPPATESAHNSTIPPLATLQDSLGAIWNVSGGQIFRNGQLTISGNVVLLLYYNHIIYQQNSSGGWWYWDNNAGGGVNPWTSTSDPRITQPPSAPPASIPAITVARQMVDLLQVGNVATDTYWVINNPWGSTGITEGTGSEQWQQNIGRALTVGPNGEVACRWTWVWPQFVGGVSTDPNAGWPHSEVKGYPSIIYGGKPGLGSNPASPWPSWSYAVRNPDGAQAPVPPGAPGNITGQWMSAGGSVVLTNTTGTTPGSNLPKQLPISTAIEISGRYQLSATGKGQLSFDFWLHNTGIQYHGGIGTAQGVTHELMIPLRNWGDYGRHGVPGGRNPGWFLYDTVIGGVTYHVYRADFGWSFVVYQHDGVAHPLDVNGKFSVNIQGIIADMVSHGLASNQYLVSLELGIEQVYGSGDVTLYDYRVNVA